LHILPPPEPQPKETFLFGYLKGEDPRVPLLLKGLAKAKVPCGLYVRNIPSAIAETLKGTSVTIYGAPQKLPEVLKSASAVLHHGGLSTTESALAAGRPQFLLPYNLEQALTANAIEEMGCGLNLVGRGADFAKLIRRSLKNEALKNHAASVSARIAERKIEDALSKVISACLQCLN
jgi:UDP-N-acetylglucosamine:LPS N-acetylglucosamine transferase